MFRSPKRLETEEVFTLEQTVGLSNQATLSLSQYDLSIGNEPTEYSLLMEHSTIAMASSMTIHYTKNIIFFRSYFEIITQIIWIKTGRNLSGNGE